MKKSFEKMSREERAELIRPLIEGGMSFGAVAKKFGVERGLVAGICRDYDIHSKYEPGFNNLPKSSSGVVLKLAVTEAEQCEAMVDSHRCASVKMTDSRFCALPTHQALEQRRLR